MTKEDSSPKLGPSGIPPHAVYAWKEGNSIHVHMDGHQVAIRLQDWEWLASQRSCPNSEHGLASCPSGGLRTLALLLKSREALDERTIGSAPSPTQWDVETGQLTKLHRAEERLKRAQEAKVLRDKAKAEAEATLSEKKAKMGVLSSSDLLKELGL